MKKISKFITALTLSLLMGIGVGVGIGSSSGGTAKQADAAIGKGQTVFIRNDGGKTGGWLADGAKLKLNCQDTGGGWHNQILSTVQSITNSDNYIFKFNLPSDWNTPKTFQILRMDSSGNTQWNYSNTITVTGSTHNLFSLDSDVGNDSHFGEASASISKITLSQKTGGTISCKVSGSDTNVPSNSYVYSDHWFDLKATPSTGYTFDKWQANGSDFSSGGTNNPVTLQGVAADTDFNAVFKAKTTSVTLNANGGTGGATSVTATYGEAMPKLSSVASRAGYTLTGYWDATSGGTKYYNANGTSAKNWDKEDSSKTLYAQWTPNDNTPYKVKHYKQTTALGDNYELTDTDNLTGTTGTNTNAQAKTYTGFKNKTFSQKSISGDGSTVVNIYYERNELTLTFNTHGAQAIKPMVIYYGAPVGELPTPELSGFVFDGWYTEPDGAGTLVTSSSSFTVNQTIHAKWVQETVQHKVTLCGGSHGAGSKEYLVNEGASFTFPTQDSIKTDVSINAGYAFKEWNTSIDGTGTSYKPTDTYNVTGPVTFYAIAQIKYYGMAGSTRFELTYDVETNTFNSSTSVFIDKDEELKLMDSSNNQKIYAGIDGDSEGVWKDLEQVVTCQEDDGGTFNFSLIDNNEKFWLTTYSGQVDVKYSAYIGGQRQTMTPCDVTPEQEAEGMFEQFETTFDNVLVGDAISFQSNYTQTGKIAYRRDTNSNQYVDPQAGTLGGIRISGSVHVYLKHFEKEESGETVQFWTVYISGLTNNAYNLIIEDKTNKTARLIPLTEGKDPSGNTQYEAYGKSVYKDEIITVYNGGDDNYFNFTHLDYNGSKHVSPYPFDFNGGDIKVVTSDCYNFFFKMPEYGVNQLFINDADETAVAKDFAQQFNLKIGGLCILAGGHREGFDEEWENQSDLFDNLSDGVKAIFEKGYKPAPTDEDIVACLEKYDFIVGKYLTIDDFMLRRDSVSLNNNSGLNKSFLTEVTEVISSGPGLAILITSITAITIAGTFFILKKKKED